MPIWHIIIVAVVALWLRSLLRSIIDGGGRLRRLHISDLKRAVPKWLLSLPRPRDLSTGRPSVMAFFQSPFHLLLLVLYSVLWEFWALAWVMAFCVWVTAKAGAAAWNWLVVPVVNNLLDVKRAEPRPAAPLALPPGSITVTPIGESQLMAFKDGSVAEVTPVDNGRFLSRPVLGPKR